MASVRIGLAGLGHWPREAYAPILKQLDAASVCAVSARTTETQQLASREFGQQTAVYNDFRELLADQRVEAVMVALPNQLHAEAIGLALASGKHVFYEPPISHVESEIRHLLAAMTDSDRVVQADLELRYLPVIRVVRRLLAESRVGEPRMAKVRLWCNWGCDDLHVDEHVQQAGFFPWLGCWYLDVLDSVFAATPVRAGVFGGYATGRLMDHGWATLEYPDSRTGQFEFSLIATTPLEVRLSVLGTAGELEADLITGHYRWRAAPGTWHEASRPASEPVHGFAGMRECIADFLDAIRDGRPPEADLHVARRVHAGMLACAASERQRASVKVAALD